VRAHDKTTHVSTSRRASRKSIPRRRTTCDADGPASSRDRATRSRGPTALSSARGGLLAYTKAITNHNAWIGHHQGKDASFYAIAIEPAEEKQHSYKVIAELRQQFINGKSLSTRGRVLIYLRKGVNNDPAIPVTVYGSRIIFKKPMKPIKGYGNPGGFDYGRYCLLKGITHQVFLDEGEYRVLDKHTTSRLWNLIYRFRDKIIKTIRKYIKGEKERGLAEALLIGYKDDLDKSLVQAYADTGVVHIIAISGLHVGLVYWLLLRVFYPLRRFKPIARVASVFVIAGLWIFSLLAGAQPSILRAAVMFTCLVIEKEVSARSSIYNSIAFSAFILLCIDPFWLFDAGFQLSYAAVVSIIAFMKPVYTLVFIKNKWLDQLWKMNAVTIAAQVFTLPLCLYYFHQFPNYFLITNFIAVPLSTIILFGEILLLTVSSIPPVAKLLGNTIEYLITFMNGCIELVASLSFATWENLQVSVLQAIILMIIAACIAIGLTEKSGSLIRGAMFFIALFFCLRSLSFLKCGNQQILIVYHVSRATAIDMVNGRRSVFFGDSLFYSNPQNGPLFLQPARTLLRFSTSRYEKSINGSRFFVCGGKKIWFTDTATVLQENKHKVEIDLLILSKNPRLYLKNIIRSVIINQVVFDGSVPTWKSRYWKKDCDSLHIPWHDVSTDGAFVINTR
jgi:competence protein ComEC